MSPKRTENLSPPVSRLFLIDKPPGVSSFAALGALKRALGTGKVGHAGTLDPFATGLLIAVSGKLTKSAGMLSDMDKEYQAVFRFGRETDTLDTEGRVIAEAEIPDIEDIRTAAAAFHGSISQIPPSFSAVKIDGQRAYAQARKGLDVPMPSRVVSIHELELGPWNPPELTVRIRCSKGTYIRSIARDLGLAAGSRAYCQSLRRTGIGPFSVEEACLPDALGINDGVDPVEYFRRIGIMSAEVGESAAAALRVGTPPRGIQGLPEMTEGALLLVDHQGKPAALVENREGKPGYRIVFDG